MRLHNASYACFLNLKYWNNSDQFLNQLCVRINSKIIIKLRCQFWRQEFIGSDIPVILCTVKHELIFGSEKPFTLLNLKKMNLGLIVLYEKGVGYLPCYSYGRYPIYPSDPSDFHAYP